MRSCGACDATIAACLSATVAAEVQEEWRRSSGQAGTAETATQSQMQVEIRSMRAVRFGDSKKLVVHTWPARPPTRSYQSWATWLSTCPRQSLQLDSSGLPVARFTWSCLGSTNPALALPSAASALSLLVLMRIRS